MGTVSAMFLKSCFATCVEHGCPPPLLVDVIDCGPKPFENPTRRFDNETLIEMMHAAEKETGETRLGLFAGMTFRPSSTLDMALVSSATLRQAFTFYEKYQPVTQQIGKTNLHVRGDKARILWRPHLQDAERMRPITETSFGAYAVFGRWMTWLHDQKVDFMQFRHASTPHADYTREVFGCDVEYDAPIDCMTFDSSLVDLPLPQANPELHDVLRKRLDTDLHALSAPPTARDAAYQCVRSMFDEGVPCAARVAAALDISERTLRRRLERENASFRMVLEEVRRDLCEMHLRGGQKSMREISDALGYSEQSAFSRAFRTWFGKSPSDHIAAS